MDTLVAKITAPAPSRSAAESSEGYGNLDARGAIAGMDVPGVPDVSTVIGRATQARRQTEVQLEPALAPYRLS